MRRNPALALGAAFAVALLSGCSGGREGDVDLGNEDKAEKDRAKYGSIHGGEGLTLFSTFGRGNDDQNGAAVGGGGLAVNPFLWRAALETTDFMPLSQTDPVGGVIITDWYAPPETPDERFKLTIYVLDRELRSDAVKVSVFRQERSDERGWNDVPVTPGTASSIEDNILTLARELRVAAINTGG